MKRPDLSKVLKPLKGFQQKTVDHAFQRLFLDADGTDRFLVADEVGLGKTLVARGIIARMIDYLWDKVDRLDIVYICSNASIARQNLQKLRISGADQREQALATRLTLLATQLAPQPGQPSLANSKLNFVSFTPGTSLKMGQATGTSRERELLFLLVHPHIERWTPLANLLQAQIKDAGRWRKRLQSSDLPIEKGIKKRFDRRLKADKQLIKDIRSAIDQWFKRKRKHLPNEARIQRNNIVGRLRQMLAEICVGRLEADLVILDEFQRFKGLLESRPENQDPAAQLAQALFEAKTPEGRPVKTLLLSATPYKLYTTNAEIDQEDHYEDFLFTTRFLLRNDESRVSDLQKHLTKYGRALKYAASGSPANVVAARKGVERILTKVMARTERVAVSEQHDAMVEEDRESVDFKPADVKQYLAADALFKAVGARDPLPFWKSAPYLPHFMKDYRFNSQFAKTLAEDPELIGEVLKAHKPAFLSAKDIKAFERIDPSHGKLRELLAEVVDGGLWQLLWVPPTICYWPLSGPFKGQEGKTKSLLFSAWNVVPDVVSAVLSYETERLMAKGNLEYRNLEKQQGQLLRLAPPSTTSKRASHRMLLLLLPCIALSDKCHPLAAPRGVNRERWVRDRARELLSTLPNPRKGETDSRWEWAFPLLFDPSLREFLRSWQQDLSIDRPSDKEFDAYVEELLSVTASDLGKRPKGLLDLIVDVALGSPSVLACRTLLSARISDDARRRYAVEIGMSLRSLFNRPIVITMLRSDDEPYWCSVLRYARAGNLQAVLDEAWHLIWEQHSWAADRSAEECARDSTAHFAGSIKPATSRVQAKFYKARRDGVEESTLSVRTDLALRFGKARSEDEKQQLNRDGVRAAFNSPFRPFILASTSIGQEGLDFHPWCHRLVHWNLPGNPVDLEQREGRVHRYKGHAVRRNVAEKHANKALSRWRLGEDLWQLIFEAANEAKKAGESDLIPYWIAPGKYHIERRVPMLPWTREEIAFGRLKKQLAAYRVVFGQPRQEELLSLLERADLEIGTLKEWMIDLRPN